MNQIDAAMIFARADFVSMLGLNYYFPPIVGNRSPKWTKVLHGSAWQFFCALVRIRANRSDPGIGI
jgi:hypothetical protein